MLRSPTLLVILAAALLLEGGARASSIVGAPLEGSVRAGEVVTLSVLLDDERIEELEIDLSLRDGDSFPIRLCRELPWTTRTVTWRVPNLPVPSARLRLRVGGGAGADRFERVAYTSAPFAIQPSRGARAPVVRADRGRRPRRAELVRVEWWVDEDEASDGLVSEEPGPRLASRFRPTVPGSTLLVTMRETRRPTGSAAVKVLVSGEGARRRVRHRSRPGPDRLSPTSPVPLRI